MVAKYFLTQHLRSLPLLTRDSLTSLLWGIKMIGLHFTAGGLICTDFIFKGLATRSKSTSPYVTEFWKINHLSPFDTKYLVQKAENKFEILFNGGLNTLKMHKIIRRT